MFCSFLCKSKFLSELFASQNLIVKARMKVKAEVGRILIRTRKAKVNQRHPPKLVLKYYFYYLNLYIYFLYLLVYVVVQFHRWFNFSSIICFKLIIIHYHTQKQRKIKFKQRMKLNHNIII